MTKITFNSTKVLRVRLFAVGCALLTSTLGISQEIIDMMNQDAADLKEVRSKADEYFGTVGTGKGSGYKLFKRWEHHAMSNLQPDGKVVSKNAIAASLVGSRKVSRAATASSNWTELGPLAWTNTSGYNPGVGRITAIAVEPTNQQLIYAGSPGGGLWKTTNGGSSWTPKGDQFGNMNIWSIAIDPTNSNIVYIGNSVGEIYKSTNGATSFTKIMDQNSGRVTDILINPSNTSVIHAALRYNGLFRTTNGGTSWTEVINTSIEDVEYKPGSTTTIYACGNDFYRSTNSGTSFTKVTSGISSNERMKLAVSPANSNYVYIVQKKGGGFGYLYRSTNSGVSFAVRTDHTAGTNYIGAQGSRDMAIAVSNTNINEVHIGGFNMYKSTNGGSSFAKECDWYYPSTTSGTYAYVHADIEVMQYINGSIFVGSDGGIFKSTNAGGDFADLTTGMGVHQLYRINSSATDKNMVIGGSQDNGTTVMTGPAHQWKHWIGADGMDCAIHPTNANIMFGCIQYGSMRKSTNGGNSLASMVTPPQNGNGNWVTPIAIDPSNGNRIYAGYTNLYRHDNAAISGSWVNTNASFSFNSKLSHIELCPSNSNVIYVATYSTVYKSSNITSASPTWTTLSGISGTVNDIAVDPYNENRVAVCTSYGRIYLSTNGGSSWTQIESGLPSGVPVKSIVMDRSSNKGIYAALNGAVYFKNNTLSTWTTFSTNLPKVDMTEVDLFYGGAGESRVRLGTYGRGLWESVMYDDAQNGNGGGGGLTCGTTISSFPYNESFETGLGHWSQGSGDDLNWTRQTGGTPSSGTGPSAAANGSYYMYLETSSPNYPSKTAILESGCFDLSSVSSPNLTFKYHMLGSAVGTLKLEATKDGSAWTTIWTRSATQGSAWNNGTVSLSSYTSGKVKFRFVATSGTSWQGDICIDQLQISNGSGGSSLSCSSTVSSFPYNESFESGLGHWSQGSGDDMDWTRRSGSTPSVGTGPTAAANGTYYMYMEVSSPNYPTKKAYLNSGCYDFSSLSSPQLTFRYHMIGSAVGTIKLEVTKDGTNWTSVWSKTGAQGTGWNTATVNLGAYAGSKVKMRFNGVSGTSWQGDICIDQLNISGSSPSVVAVDELKNDLDKDILVFPNPAVSTIHIQLTSSGEEIRLLFTDLTGRTMLNRTFETHEGLNLLKVDGSSLATGTYLVQIVRGEKIVTKKLLIQH